MNQFLTWEYTQKNRISIRRDGRMEPAAPRHRARPAVAPAQVWAVTWLTRRDGWHDDMERWRNWKVNHCGSGFLALFLVLGRWGIKPFKYMYHIFYIYIYKLVKLLLNRLCWVVPLGLQKAPISPPDIKELSSWVDSLWFVNIVVRTYEYEIKYH